MIREPLRSETFVNDMSKLDCMMPNAGTSTEPMTPLRHEPSTMTRKNSSFRALDQLRGSRGEGDGSGLRISLRLVPSTPVDDAEAVDSKSTVPTGNGTSSLWSTSTAIVDGSGRRYLFRCVYSRSRTLRHSSQWPLLIKYSLETILTTADAQLHCLI